MESALTVYQTKAYSLLEVHSQSSHCWRSSIARSSTLPAGTSRSSTAVGVVGTLISGRPKESTLDAGITISSMTGIGIDDGGAPVMVGRAIEGRLMSDGSESSQRIAAGRSRSLRMLFEGRSSWLGSPRKRVGMEGGMAGSGVAGSGGGETGVEVCGLYLSSLELIGEVENVGFFEEG